MSACVRETGEEGRWEGRGEESDMPVVFHGFCYFPSLEFIFPSTGLEVIHSGFSL